MKMIIMVTVSGSREKLKSEHLRGISASLLPRVLFWRISFMLVLAHILLGCYYLAVASQPILVACSLISRFSQKGKVTVACWWAQYLVVESGASWVETSTMAGKPLRCHQLDCGLLQIAIVPFHQDAVFLAWKSSPVFLNAIFRQVANFMKRVIVDRGILSCLGSEEIIPKRKPERW